MEREFHPKLTEGAPTCLKSELWDSLLFANAEQSKQPDADGRSLDPQR